MSSKGTVANGALLDLLDTDACLRRGQVVRNAMSVHEARLQDDGATHAEREQARKTIDAAWSAITRRGAGKEGMRYLLEVVDAAANTPLTGRPLGEEVLSHLPPELLMRFVAIDAVELGALAEAWRKMKPGRTGAPGKWKALTQIWARTTGEGTTGEVWETTWRALRRVQRARKSR